MPGISARDIRITIDENNFVPQQLHPYQLQALKHDYRALIEENGHDPVKLEAAQKAFKRVLNSIGYRIEVHYDPPA
ncbi:hypothetical protein CEF21_10645 [Bacillus sp. FJAT-42376]|uniref:hypothetical protein n=1 Tax=Bacillus sp. FJAT-42376 TaxID=2014076 RepID=UPI000F510E5B|nr:hypothetical protein [Bacillus sp. FJAT-42376]AZB42714.1 hypothetical protein CEF21_10645 [Bacillus sp. FJAT-42376]